jgi:hypothetical protein
MSAHSQGPMLRAALTSALLLLAVTSVLAQTVELPGGLGMSPVTPLPGTVGGAAAAGPGLSPGLSSPGLTPTLVVPSAPPPVVEPPVTAAAPAAPGPVVATPRVVRFRCDVAPQEQSCREKAEAPDGGDDDSECSCAHDLCLDQTDPAGGPPRRICEKLQ